MFFNQDQKRILLLTNLNVYNVKNTEIKRTIDIKKLKCLTMSSKAAEHEFVIHVSTEYDYRFYGEFRREIIDAIKHTWWLIHKKNLPVYSVDTILEEHYT